MTMTLISTVTLTSVQTNIEITNIPQTGTDLLVYVSGQINGASGPYGVNPRYNGLAYTTKVLSGDGSAVTSATTSPHVFPGTGYATFSNSVHYITNYTTTGAHSVSIDGVVENNATASSQKIAAILTTSTDPITSIGFNSTLINIGTTVSLYMITKGSGGASVA